MFITDKDGKWEVRDGFRFLVEPSEDWIDSHKETKEEKKQKILQELKKTDDEMVRLIDDLAEFCKTLGFVSNTNKEQLILKRKQLRQQLEDLGG